MGRESRLKRIRTLIRRIQDSPKPSIRNTKELGERLQGLDAREVRRVAALLGIPLEIEEAENDD